METFMKSCEVSGIWNDFSRMRGTRIRNRQAARPIRPLRSSLGGYKFHALGFLPPFHSHRSSSLVRAINCYFVFTFSLLFGLCFLLHCCSSGHTSLFFISRSRSRSNSSSRVSSLHHVFSNYLYSSLVYLGHLNLFAGAQYFIYLCFSRNFNNDAFGTTFKLGF